MALNPNWINALLDSRRSIDLPVYGKLRVQPDWAAPQRTLAAHLFYYVIDREMVADFAAEVHKIGSGSLLWIAPNTSHALSIPSGKSPFRVIYFRLVLGQRPRSEPTSMGQYTIAHDAREIE